MKLNEYIELQAYKRRVPKIEVVREIARDLSVSVGAVNMWYQDCKKIGPISALMINEITGNKVRLSDLRSDLWNKEIKKRI